MTGTDVILLIIGVLALPVLAVIGVHRHYTSWQLYRRHVPSEAIDAMRAEATDANTMRVIIIDDQRDRRRPE